MTDEEILQEVLDEWKRRYDLEGRFPRWLPYYLVNPGIDTPHLISVLDDSELFDRHSGSTHKISKIGRDVAYKFDWNYKKYLDSMSEVERLNIELIQSNIKANKLQSRIAEVQDDHRLFTRRVMLFNGCLVIISIILTIIGLYQATKS